jgi:DoxX-like family
MAIEQSQGGAAVAPGKGVIWVSRIMSALPVLLMGMSAAMKLSRSSQVVEGWAKSGYPAATLLPIGLVELACAIVHLIPRTAVLGAVLVTGYLGGAVATHVRAGEAVFVVPFVLGMMAWGGLFLRDPRLRALLPLRE